MNNRGNKLALGMFNRSLGGPGPDAKNPAGDGFLMRHGFTVVWSGWIGELIPSHDRLLLQPPVARAKDGSPLRGLVRFEMSCDAPTKAIPLSRRDHHGSYWPEKATLTKRLREGDPREMVPPEKWKLEKRLFEASDGGVSGSLPQVILELQGSFVPGVLYELIGEAENPLVQGVGLAGVRDLIAFLRHDGSERNPLAAQGKSTIRRTHAFGVSQSGRFLRHLLWEGFNEDEKGRIVFDGLMPHVAGGGVGCFNHRFAQPTRHNGQHEDHLYPADIFPFTYGPSVDPFTKREGSILGAYARSRTQPKIMHTQSAAEYWHRAGSLVHTDPLAKADSDLPANVRVYAFGGTQHGPAAFPPKQGIGEHSPNFANYRPFLRALLLSLDAWVRDGKEPPPSVYPKIADGTLVDWKLDAVGFPAIPGVLFPAVIQAPAYAKYQDDEGNAIEPPKVLGHYAVRVPKADRDGNDLGTMLPPEVAVPLGTFTGWNLRRKEVGAEGMLASLQGSFLPLPWKPAPNDPRVATSQRYADEKAYINQLDRVCETLVRAGVLLAEDRPRYAAHGAALWRFAAPK